MEQSPSRAANRSAANHEVNYILWNSKLHYLAHKSTPTLHILSQMNKVQSLPFYFFRIHFNIILPSTPTSSKRLQPSGFPSKVCMYCLSIPCVPHVPPISSTLLLLLSYATQLGIFCFISSVLDVKTRNYKTIILSVFCMGVKPSHSVWKENRKVWWLTKGHSKRIKQNEGHHNVHTSENIGVTKTRKVR